MQITVRLAMRWLCIICALSTTLLLGACSASRLAYTHAPTVGFYWLDAYFDFDGPQSVATKDSLQALQAWHRAEELPQLARLLALLQPMALQDVTPEQVCGLRALVQQRIQAPLVHATPAAVRIISTLKPAQLQHMEAEFKKRNAQWREEWLELPQAERLDKRSKQVAERTEQFYGRLSGPQRDLIRAQVAASGYSPEVQHKEMLRRQQDSLQTFARLRQGTLPAEKAQVELQALFERAAVSPDAATQQYVESMGRATCAAIATVHNSATPEQRASLQKSLQGYEADARALMQGP
jgi:hypothetical protein